MLTIVLLLVQIGEILLALALTILIECGLSLIFRSRELTYSVFLCNLLTNPLMNLLLLLFVGIFSREYYYVALAILEVAVVGVEAWLITLMTSTKPRKALLLSLFFNASSLGIGLLLLWLV